MWRTHTRQVDDDSEDGAADDGENLETMASNGGALTEGGARKSKSVRMAADDGASDEDGEGGSGKVQGARKSLLAAKRSGAGKKHAPLVAPKKTKGFMKSAKKVLLGWLQTTVKVRANTIDAIKCHGCVRWEPKMPSQQSVAWITHTCHTCSLNPGQRQEADPKQRRCRAIHGAPPHLGCCGGDRLWRLVCEAGRPARAARVPERGGARHLPRQPRAAHGAMAGVFKHVVLHAWLRCVDAPPHVIWKHDLWQGLFCTTASAIKRHAHLPPPQPALCRATFWRLPQMRPATASTAARLWPSLHH